MLFHTPLTAHRTRVTRCALRADGRYDVQLAEQLLYPEGGGQPSDGGWIGGHAVLELTRGPEGPVHVLAAPVADEVEVRLDVARRRDHTQQHSGQHLLSALAQDRFGLRTTAFHLGPEHSDVEVAGDGGTTEVGPDTLQALQDLVNDAIREGRTVSTRHVAPEAMAELPVRTRGLPAGHTGLVRLVEIDGIDLNTCGGTHVADLRELGGMVLLGTERLGRALRIRFVVGDRVVRSLQRAQAREDALTRVLTCPPEAHLAAVRRLQDEAKAAGKAHRALQAELAGALGSGLVPVVGSLGPVVLWHRDDADASFLAGVAEAARAGRPDTLVVVTGGRTEGSFAVGGPEALVAAQGPRVAEALGGRGGGARGKYQGKTPDVARRDRLPALLGL